MKNDSKTNVKVLVIGGGFAGVQTALDLANAPGVEVRLISDKNYFEYHAALYRSYTGRSPMEVAVPLAEIFSGASNVEVLQDRASGVDAASRTVQGESGSSYHYDALVLALGNVTDYYGIQGLSEYSFGVKSVQEALELKRHLHEQILSGKVGEKTYVVIGGGATGVEVAGELHSYVERIRRKHGARKVPLDIHLVEAAPRILSAMPEQFSERVAKRLSDLGITIHTGTKVLAETYEAIELPGAELKSHTVIWTAGTANNPLLGKYPELFSKDSRGKVPVNDYLEAAPDIYVVGDSASTPYSGMAQTALHDAHFVAQHLLAKTCGSATTTYQPKKPAYAIPVGPRWAAVQIGSTQIYGLLGSTLRRAIDLRLFLKFLPLRKALSTWHTGFTRQEACEFCK